MIRSRIGFLISFLVIAAGLAYGFLPRPIAVELAHAEIGPLAVSVEEEGKTRVVERYTVSAPASGYLRRIALKAGDAVTAGQVIATLEPARSNALDPRSWAQARARVGSAEAALAAAGEQTRAAEAEVALAAQELERTRQLAREKFLSPQAVDIAVNRNALAEAGLRAARHAVNVARFDLEAARAALANVESVSRGNHADRITVAAPVAGRVLRLVHESEGAVLAGQPLLEIGNPASLEIEVEVLSTSAVRIVPGARVLLDRWGGAAALEGRVRVIEPSGYTKVSALGVEEQRVKVIVDFTSPRAQWERLGDGFRVEARFIVWEGDRVLQIPTSALFRHNGGWAVFVANAGRARLHPVEVGQRSGLRAEVLSGLAVGTEVITHPDDKLRDGVKIRAR